MTLWDKDSSDEAKSKQRGRSQSGARTTRVKNAAYLARKSIIEAWSSKGVRPTYKEASCGSATPTILESDKK